MPAMWVCRNEITAPLLQWLSEPRAPAASTPSHRSQIVVAPWAIMPSHDGTPVDISTR